jgi:hypothetical protein
MTTNELAPIPMIKTRIEFVRKFALPALALTAGLAIGHAWPRGDFSGNAKGALVARGALGEALDRRLAWEQQTGSKLPLIGLTFRNKSGEFCRTFFSGAHAGLACRRNDVWVVDALVRHASESAGASYRMVGSEMPEPLRTAVMGSIEGEPFNATAEVRARNNGWSGN